MSLIKRNLALEKTLEKFHCGERFKQLCIQHKRESPSEWVKILNLKSRNQVYYRWTNEEISSKELIIICDQFKITIDQFFLNEVPVITSNELNDSLSAYKIEKIYIEDQIANLVERMNNVENALKI